MRTPEEYIVELDFNAEDKLVALFVGFETCCVPIYSNDPNRLAHLTEAMEAGGFPFCFSQLKDGEVSLGMLPEYADNEDLKTIMLTLGQKLEESLNSGGVQS